jgi:hypothetical protein
MPRKSDPITVEELEEIKAQLINCQISDSLREKISKRISAEIERRKNAGASGGRPKDARETMRQIDKEASRASIEQESERKTENDFDFGA